MTFKGTEYEDLTHALGLLGVKSYSGFEEVPDVDMTVAVGADEAQEISDISGAKSWLRQSANGASIRWFGVPRQAWNALEWILQIRPDAEYASADIDQQVVTFRNFDLVTHAKMDLGGSNFGKPPIYAVLSNDRYDRTYGEDLMLISRNPRLLIEAVLDDPRQKYTDLPSTPRHIKGPVFWFSRISPNTIALILRRLAHPVPAESEETN